MASAALVAVAGLALWALVPTALGWKASVVMSGSMEPRIDAGDVVLSRPVPSGQVQVGQVLLVDDPDHPDRLRLHRLVSIDDSGALVLHGDANQGDDSSRVQPDAVHGVGALRIPAVGRPLLLARTGQYPALAATVLALAGLLALAALPATAGLTHRTGAASPYAVPFATRAERSQWLRRRARTARARSLTGVVSVAMLLVSGVGAAPAHGAPFKGTTQNATDRWGAATWFTCTEAARGDAARVAWSLTEAAGPTAADVSGNGIAGTYSATGLTYGVSGACNGRPSVAFDGSTGRVTSNAGPSSSRDVTIEVGFKTSGAHGGTILSITAPGSGGAADVTSMAIAVTATGTVTLGVNAGGVRTVTTPKAYNDNLWHLAMGVVGPGGLALYVDSAAPVTDTSVTSGATVSGSLCAGYGNRLSLGTGSYDYFQGSLAYPAYYTTSLNSSKALAHYISAL